MLPQRDQEIQRAEAAVERLTLQRDKLLQAHYAGAAPLEQLKAERARIAEQMAAAQTALTGRRLKREQLESAVEAALELLSSAGETYRQASKPVRRQLSQAVFTGLYFDDDEVADGALKPLFRALLDADLDQRLLDETRGSMAAGSAPDVSQDTQALGEVMRRLQEPAELTEGEIERTSTLRALVLTIFSW
ncbi:hypothetical protein ACFYUR_16810 [Micromonospora haikouensis]|uniref:hypothetical protein n=1 Tax=Micromonospora haikouensis TaxID=686309 RepID=UPI0036D04404